MNEGLTDKEVKAIAKYIQKKERRIAAYYMGMPRMPAPIYTQQLIRLANLTMEDKLPGSLDTKKFFPELYQIEPTAEVKKEEEETGEDTVARYIQEKERTITALNIAISQMPSSIYEKELVEVANLVLDDKLPGSIDTRARFPKLYPRVVDEKKEEEESKDQ